MAAALAVALLGPGAPAHAQLVITPTFDSSITSDPNAAAIEGVINQAIQTYENTFADPINVTIKFQEMTSGLGQSTWWYYNISYQQYINALKADAKTSNDTVALSLLPTGTANPVTGSDFINVKTANLRAVGINGLNSGLAGGFDGIIGLNTHITDVGSPGSTGQYSLLATTEHEIDEVLGLGSALASVPFNSPLPEDLFRYSAGGGRSFTTNSAAKAYFSIDGTTDLAQFDNQGDGGDYGDWQSNPRPPGVSPQVQDAFATPGAHPSLGVELTALDVIGYDLITPTAVPEPSPLVLLGVTGLLVGVVRYARRARTAA
jgi:hypothetical protein